MTSSKSFTLIELLITIFIIVFLLVLSIPLLRQFRQRTDLKMAALEIQSTILEAKSYAMAPPKEAKGIQSYSFKFGDQNDPILPNPSSYAIFETKTNLSQRIVGDIHFLPKGTSVAFVSPLSDIKFQVPEGKITGGDFVVQLNSNNPRTNPWVVQVKKETGLVEVYEKTQ